MPLGAFGTNNPTPWAFPWSQPSAPTAPAAPAPSAPAPSNPAPGGLPIFGAPTDEQMAQMGWVKDANGNWIQPMPDDGLAHATGGGGGVPGSSPTDWGQFGGNDAPFAPPTTGSGATTPDPGVPAQDPSNVYSPMGGMTLQDLLGVLSGSQDPSGIFTGSDVFGLPGRSKSGEANAQLIAQMLALLAAQQGPRAQQAEGIVGGLANQGMQSDPFRAMMEAVRTAQGRADPASLAGYRQQLRDQAASDAGQGAQTSMQRLRDAGMLGRGAMGVDPALAASNQANAQLSRQNLDIEGLMEQITGQRLGQSGQLAGAGANVYQSLYGAPQTEYANLLRQDQNPATLRLIDYLNQLAQTAVGGDVAFRAQPNDFERIGMPLMGGLLGAASDPLAALLGKT